MCSFYGMQPENFLQEQTAGIAVNGARVRRVPENCVS